MQVLSHSRIAMGLGWNVINGIFVWVMQLSFAQQTSLWDCLDLLQRLKCELGPSIMHNFTILSYPPILGGWANDQKLSKIYIFGAILDHFAIHNGQKWGDKSFMLLARIIYPHYRSWFNLIIHSLVPVLFLQSSLPSFRQIKFITAQSKF